MGEGFFSLSFVELFLFLFLAFLLLKPNEYKKISKWFGKMLNNLSHSESWQIFRRASSEMRNLPSRLMREANLDMQEAERDIRKAMDMRQKPPAISPNQVQPPPSDAENTVQAPVIKTSEPNSGQHD